MSEGFLDILIFAMVAAFLVYRLRSVLGRRTGHEQPPPQDPFGQRPKELDSEGKVIELPDRSRAGESGVAERAGPQDPLSAGLTQIQIADPGFDPEGFASGAHAAFEMIVHAFATGDTGTLRALLADDVYENFAAAIQRRFEAGETLETTVISIRSAKLVEAWMKGQRAFVTVAFESEQVNVTRDANGAILDGDPNHVTVVTDIWTFSRNTRSRDPNWKLVETRSPN